MNMSARKLGSSWWIDLRHNGTRHRIRSPENSKRGAEAYEAHVRTLLAKGNAIVEILGKRHSQTFGDFAAEWLRTYVASNNKPSEQESKQDILRLHLLPVFGHYALKDISKASIERYKTTKLAEGLSQKTVNNHLAVLHKALATAHEWGFLDVVPIIKRLQPMQKEARYFSQQEIDALLAAASTKLWRAMMFCALNTGLRIGELLGLEWGDIDFDSKALTVQRAVARGIVGTPKSNRCRTVPLGEEVLTMLKEMRASRTSKLVFTQTGALIPRCRPKRALETAAKRAGVKNAHWHAFRHTYASRLVQRGAPMRTVQQLLGHSTIVTTERYAHLAPSSLKEAVSLLDFGALKSDFGQPVGNAAPNITSELIPLRLR